jgi:hypothetical protein
VKTRTLLLLAVGCGMAILLAGTVQLLRVANQRSAQRLGVGGSGTAGDATVVVDSASLTPQSVGVTVTLSGVADPAGLHGFTLVRSGSGKTTPVGPSGGTCAAITESPTQCTLDFTVDGGDALLLFTRAGDTVRWSLTSSTATT